MIVKVLMEDTAQSPDFIAEHGLSLYIEANGHKILFDAGQSAALVQNAIKLGVDLGAVEFAVLSHAHYDHSGGLQAFLKINKHAPVYLSPFAFDEYLHAGRFIGVDPILKDTRRIKYVSQKLDIADGITLYSAQDKQAIEPVQSYGLDARRDGITRPDDFRHEQYLEIVEHGKRILFSGCSHKGIVNIVHWFKPDVLIGGFHLMKLDPAGDGKDTLDAVGQKLSAADTVYYTCHCTGMPQYNYLKHAMQERLYSLSAGQEISV